MDTKICIRCQQQKSVKNFSLDKSHNGKIYRRNVCISCRGRQGNAEKRLVRHRKYGKLHRVQRTTYERNRIKYDIIYKLTRNLRARLRLAIKNSQKKGSAINDLGCSINILKKHLESKFQPGMTWNNYGQWHIDHIRPLSSFNLQNREEFLKACHFSNLQPLWKLDNIKKGDKYEHS